MVSLVSQIIHFFQSDFLLALVEIIEDYRLLIYISDHHFPYHICDYISHWPYWQWNGRLYLLEQTAWICS